MTHHAILYRRATRDFLDLTIETSAPTEDFTALRRQRFLGVCFCGRPLPEFLRSLRLAHAT